MHLQIFANQVLNVSLQSIQILMGAIVQVLLSVYLLNVILGFVAALSKYMLNGGSGLSLHYQYYSA